jgi:hypothetical protein
MGWETRGRNRYYYRKRWIHGRPMNEYIGTGFVAEVLAESDECEREKQRREAAEWQATVRTERQADLVLDQIDDLVRSTLSAVLITHGYHTHNRQWRRRTERG